MEGDRRQLALAAVAVCAVVGVLVVVASSSGSVHPVSESTATVSPRPGPADGGASTTPTFLPSPTPPERWSRTPWELPDWLGALVEAAFVAGFALVALLLVRLLVRKVIEVVTAVRLPEPLPQDAVGHERVVSAERLARSVDESLATVATGTPSNAIVACWLALERTAAAAGVGRRASETPSEYTVRVLAAADVSQPLLERLAELYREARFSRHDLTESARTEAREALVVLRDQLATSERPA
jgi:hypothetical protein